MTRNNYVHSGAEEGTHFVAHGQVHKDGGTLRVKRAVAEVEGTADEDSATVDILVDGDSVFDEAEEVSDEDGAVEMFPSENYYASGEAPTIEVELSDVDADVDDVHVSILTETSAGIGMEIL